MLCVVRWRLSPPEADHSSREIPLSVRSLDNKEALAHLGLLVPLKIVYFGGVIFVFLCCITLCLIFFFVWLFATLILFR